VKPHLVLARSTAPAQPLHGRARRAEGVERSVGAADRLHPAIAAAAVVARDDDGDGSATISRRLVAYVVAADSAAGTPSTSELRAFLRDGLPEYLVPAVFVELAALPLMRNGKLDRAALPAPEGIRPELAVDYVAARTPTEEVLAEVWARVLGLERVGVTDNFFELGGHSLLATQVVSRLREAFGVELPLSDLFDHPTIDELATLVEARVWEEIEQMSDDEVLRTLEMQFGETGPDEEGRP